MAERFTFVQAEHDEHDAYMQPDPAGEWVRYADGARTDREGPGDAGVCPICDGYGAARWTGTGWAPVVEERGDEGLDVERLRQAIEATGDPEGYGFIEGSSTLRQYADDIAREYAALAESRPATEEEA